MLLSALVRRSLSPTIVYIIKTVSGKVDTVAQQISVTPAREEKYKFSEIYAYNPYKLSVRADDDSINSVEDLKGKRFACQPGRI